MNNRLGVKAGAHQSTEHCVGHSHDRHALVMGHERPHDRDGLPGRHTVGRKVQRFVEAMAAQRTQPGQGIQIGHRRRGIHHRGKGRRIRRDDEVSVQAALKAKPGYAEVGILIGVLRIPNVIGRLRHSPRHPLFRPERGLPTDDQPARALKQAAGRCPHYQGRHEVFEHGAGPRHEHGPACRGGDCPAKPEPFARTNVALCDRDKTCEPRFGGQQVVAVDVELSLVGQIADRQQLALTIAQKAELHRERHAAGLFLDREQPLVQIVRADGIEQVALNRVLHGCGPVGQSGRAGVTVHEGVGQCCRRPRIRRKLGKRAIRA